MHFNLSLDAAVIMHDSQVACVSNLYYTFSMELVPAVKSRIALFCSNGQGISMSTQ